MQAYTPLDPHEIHSARFLEHARGELAKGERLQASSKAWGAVTHALKDFANKRGWVYETTPHSRELAHHIGHCMDDIQTIAYYEVAYGLHMNFYRDTLTCGQLAANLDIVETLIDKIREADQRMGPDTPEPEYSVGYKKKMARNQAKARRSPASP